MGRKRFQRQFIDDSRVAGLIELDPVLENTAFLNLRWQRDANHLAITAALNDAVAF